jgi:hypothetical protein
MELRMQIDDQFMNALMDKMNIRRPPEAVREALTLLNWAVEELRRNRVILSSDSDGKEVARLAMPALDRIEARPATTEVRKGKASVP